MEPVKTSLIQHLKDFATYQPDDLLFVDEDKSYTSQETYEVVMKLASFFKEKGMKKGTIVAFAGIRSVDSSIIWTALQAVETQVAMCDPHSSVKEFMENTGLDIPYEYDIDFSNNVWTLNGVPFDFDSAKDYEMLECPDIDVMEPALIIFTSGTTGKSKGVEICQYNLVNHIYNYQPVSGRFTDKERVIQILPIFHMYGLTQVVYNIVLRYPLYFPKEVTVEAICNCIDKYQITRICLVPSLALAMCKAKLENKCKLDSLLAGAVGGAPSTAEQIQFIEKTIGIKIGHVYGMSECISISTAPPEWPVEKRIGVGKPFPMSKVKISEIGEITVNAPTLFLGYYGERRMDRDEFFHTGDLGYFDEDGNLHINGRIKDLIIRNGNNISSVAIEQKLISLPFIEQAVVFGVPDEKVGEIPYALVILAEGTSYDEDAVKKVLTKIEYPKKIEIVKEFPYNTGGKVDKLKLKEIYK